MPGTQHMGVIGIRVLAAGALSGSEARHPIAVPTVAPIASGPDYATDVQRAQILRSLERERHGREPCRGVAALCVEQPDAVHVLLGYSSLEHLELAAACIARGPLPTTTLDRLSGLWQQLR